MVVMGPRFGTGVPELGPLIPKGGPPRKCLLNTPGQSKPRGTSCLVMYLPACKVLSVVVVVVVCLPSQLHGLPYLFYSRNLLTDLAVSSILSDKSITLLW
jgi:hypothetical protein